MTLMLYTITVTYIKRFW